MNTQDKQAVKLAAAVVCYGRDNYLSLGGLVDRIEADCQLTQETADAVIKYCVDHSLTLNGLLITIVQFHNELNELGLASVADEIKSVAAEYIDSRYDELTTVQKACLVEITTSLSIVNSRVIALWEHSRLTY